MYLIKQAWIRCVALFRKREVDLEFDREFDEEASSHIALAAEDYVQRGMPFDEARRLARIKFGSIEASKDAHRDSRGLPWLEGLLYDLRFTLRRLRRDRTFTLAAIAMLALVLGLNVTVFTVMDAMLFRGYPLVQRNDRLVFLQERYPSGLCCISYRDFEAWRSQTHTFAAMSFVGEKQITLVDGVKRPMDTLAFLVSANTFGVLGVPPMLGRNFAPADEVVGTPPVAILNYRFWASRFASRRDIAGLGVHINGTPATIIGVMPEGFEFPTEADLWMPMTRTPEFDQRGLSPGGFIAIGRLRDDADLRAARTELETINGRLEAAHPATNRRVVPRADTYSKFAAGENASRIFGSLWAGACFVLLIACANLANLSLVRTIARWREWTTRVALGAGLGRMVRQILMESVALAGAAGALGWWVAKWSVHAWAVATASPYQVLDYSVNSGTLAYSIAISVAAAILLSLAPIGRVLQLRVSGTLTSHARGVTQGRRGKHLGVRLVAGQMALTVVLLSGTGVLVRSLLKIVNAPTGVHDPGHILVGHLMLPSDKYPTPVTRLGYFDRLEAKLKTIPGIEGEALSTTIPPRSTNRQMFEIEGRPSPPGAADAVQFMSAGPDYFRVLGATAISGREFNDRDGAAASPVALVNQSFAAAYWPHEQPLGKRLRSLNRNQPAEWLTVVGVVSNVMQGDPTRQRFVPLVYVPFRQRQTRGAYFFLRTAVPPGQVAQAVRAEVQKLDTDVILDDFTALKARLAFDRDYMDPEHSELQKQATVAPIFAVIALLLAAVGLYALVAYSVVQRDKEIGIRIAIGAAAEDIRRMIFRDGLMPVVTGMCLGLVASLGLNRILQSQLVGVSPDDPVTLAGAPLLLILVALLACHIPARRAMNIDPVVALRND